VCGLCGLAIEVVVRADASLEVARARIMVERSRDSQVGACRRADGGP